MRRLSYSFNKLQDVSALFGDGVLLPIHIEINFYGFFVCENGLGLGLGRLKVLLARLTLGVYMCLYMGGGGG